MIEPRRGFETAELANRCSQAQQAMIKRDIGALLLTSEADVRYFTGFMTQFWQSPTRPWFVLLPVSGKPIAVIPSIGEQLMKSCYVGDMKLWASPAESDDGITLLATVIREHFYSAVSFFLQFLLFILYLFYFVYFFVILQFCIIP